MHSSVEFDPAHTDLMTEVENLVEDKMNAEGSHGDFGSCHRSWELKKDLLQQRGIKWRSPSELNPNICYD